MQQLSKKTIFYKPEKQTITLDADQFIDLVKKSLKNRKPSHVYVVLGHYSSCADYIENERIYGIYTTKSAAKDKRDRIEYRGLHKGYVSILRIRLKGE